MNERTLFLPHPIVFVLDFDNAAAEVPTYCPTSVTAANDSCISINAIADVDGEATITLVGLLETAPTENYKAVFEGVIATPGRKVAVITSENLKLVETEVPDARSAIAIFVDDEAHPSKILVKVVPDVRVSEA